MCIHVWIYVCMYVWYNCKVLAPNFSICTCVFVYGCMYACVYEHTCKVLAPNFSTPLTTILYCFSASLYCGRCMCVCLHACMYVCMYVCTLSWWLVLFFGLLILWKMYVCMFACMHACMYVWMCSCSDTLDYLYRFLASLYCGWCVCVYICMYDCVCLLTLLMTTLYVYTDMHTDHMVTVQMGAARVQTRHITYIHTYIRTCVGLVIWLRYKWKQHVRKLDTLHIHKYIHTYMHTNKQTNIWLCIYTYRPV
jgi:hypothetical protein